MFLRPRHRYRCRTLRFSLLQPRVHCINALRIASLLEPHFYIAQTSDAGGVHGARGFAYQPLPFLIQEIDIAESHIPLFNCQLKYSTFEVGLRFQPTPYLSAPKAGMAVQKARIPVRRTRCIVKCCSRLRPGHLFKAPVVIPFGIPRTKRSRGEYIPLGSEPFNHRARQKP
jgi:hypothetical protein